MKKREFKGKSLIDFIDDYTVIDIETTGLDSRFCDIIEIGAIKFRRGEKVDSFSSLTKPNGYFLLDEDDEDDREIDDYIIDDNGDRIQYVDEFIAKLTGITNKMLENAPSIEKILLDFKSFIGDDLLIGHNVNFDINFLYDELLATHNICLSNDFIDTLRIARKTLPQLKKHRLDDLLVYYKVESRSLHRSLSDCEKTNEILLNLKNDAISKFGSIDLFKKSFAKKQTRLDPASIVSEVKEFDETHPLFGKVCVFTGTLEKMVRKDAMQIVANLGGINGNSVTAKTNFLILGNNDYCSSIKDGKSSKQKKAEKNILKGQDLVIISEDVFYDMIDNNVFVEEYSS